MSTQSKANAKSSSNVDTFTHSNAAEVCRTLAPADSLSYWVNNLSTSIGSISAITTLLSRPPSIFEDAMQYCCL